MTKTMDVSPQLQLSDILNSIEQGNEVVLRRDGRVIAEVKPVEAAAGTPHKERVLGLSRGAVTYIADDFDAELPDSFWLGEE